MSTSRNTRASPKMHDSHEMHVLWDNNPRVTHKHTKQNVLMWAFINRVPLHIIYAVDGNVRENHSSYIIIVQPQGNEVVLENVANKELLTIGLLSILHIESEKTMDDNEHKITKNAFSIRGGATFTHLKTRDGVYVKKLVQGRERSIYVDQKRRQYVKVKGAYVALAKAKIGA